MKYKVGVKEIHINYVEIEADSEEGAKTLVAGGSGESVGTKYLENMAEGVWTVEPIPSDYVWSGKKTKT